MVLKFWKSCLHVVLDWIRGKVVSSFHFVFKVWYFLFNGVLYLFVDGELRFESSSLCLLMLPFQLTELLCDTAEPGRQLPCMGCAMAERGVLVKDRTEMTIVVTDRTSVWGSIRKILFKAPMSNFLRHWYQKVSGFCTGTDTSNLHKRAVWSDFSPGVVL